MYRTEKKEARIYIHASVAATGFDVVNRKDFEEAVKKAVETKDDADYRAYMKFFKLNKWGGI